ncbi:unnamed protein product [Plutella xylostella]|uniref:(diamondback moth) hypothetical protein n=1 Tax=Plutella xylostella TaxID=51655 RepID=A0A8S4EXJ2_PLUXY|nr:unnamed protein product [Plutella xylostella]
MRKNNLTESIYTFPQCANCAPLFELTHEEEEEERHEAIEGQAHAQGRDPPAQQPQQRRADRALHAGRGARASLVAQLRRR